MFLINTEKLNCLILLLFFWGFHIITAELYLGFVSSEIPIVYRNTYDFSQERIFRWL